MVEESVKLKEGNMRLPSGGRIKKLCDDISPLANYYQVYNNCMVYPTSLLSNLRNLLSHIKDKH